MSGSRYLTGSDKAAYIRDRNREFDRVRFTPDTPKLERWTALLAKRVEVFNVLTWDTAIVVGDDLGSVASLALSAGFGDPLVYDQHNELVTHFSASSVVPAQLDMFGAAA